MPKMGDFFLAQIRDFFTEDVCFHTSEEGKGGAPTPRSPILCEGQSEKGRSPVPWEVRELRPAWPKCPVGTEGGSPDRTIAYLI
jgi:hypothetical protein